MSYTEHAEGLAEVMAETPETLRWNNRDWQVCTGGAQLRMPAQQGGFGPDSDLVCVAIAYQFTSYYGQTPEQVRDTMMNTVAIYRSRTYRIESVTITPDGLQYTIQLTDAAKSH
jgi:hypothetical protein